MRRGWRALLFCLLLGACAHPALARPEFAAKEGKTCDYCHFNPKGGGPRNYRGIYYARHGHSFAGFNDVLIPPPPTLSLVWQETFPSRPTRVAIADTVGNGHPGLLILDPGARTDLRILRALAWDEGTKQLRETGSVQLSKDADWMEAGRFVPGAPAVVTMGSGFVSFNGKAYTFQPGRHVGNFLSAMSLRTPNDLLMTFDGQNPATHTVNPAGGQDWLSVSGKFQAFSGPDLCSMDFRGETLPLPLIAGYFGVPGPLDDLKFFGEWNPRSEDENLIYVPERGAGALPSRAGLYSADEKTPEWLSPELSGPVLDITTGPDVRTGSGDGLYVLATGSHPRDPNTLYFFGLKKP
jgi:hypothetical protein